MGHSEFYSPISYEQLEVVSSDLYHPLKNFNWFAIGTSYPKIKNFAFLKKHPNCTLAVTVQEASVIPRQL